jgi:hypothetical protein
MKTPTTKLDEHLGEYLEFDFDFSGCPESGNLHLFFTDELFTRIDHAMALGKIKTREDFGTLAIFYVLEQMESGATVASESSENTLTVKSEKG